jgi:hypothetical protein
VGRDIAEEVLFGSSPFSESKDKQAARFPLEEMELIYTDTSLGVAQDASLCKSVSPHFEEDSERFGLLALL